MIKQLKDWTGNGREREGVTRSKGVTEWNRTQGRFSKGYTGQALYELSHKVQDKLDISVDSVNVAQALMGNYVRPQGNTVTAPEQT